MKKVDWEKIWEKHLEKYRASEPHVGRFVYVNLKGIQSSLELGCGSARDSYFLATKGIRATASDYAEENIRRLSETLRHDNLVLRTEDAFSLQAADDSFDLVFHDGLFIYFHDDGEIRKLVHEQVRVSRKYVLIVVHNALNHRLMEEYAEKSKSDPLFDIRFFTPQEIMQLVESCDINPRRIAVRKVMGGRLKRVYRYLSEKGIRGLFDSPVSPDWLQKWNRTERIACLVEL